MPEALLVLALVVIACAKPPGPAPQNPSPMVESTRVHERVEKKSFSGERFAIEGALPKPVEVFLPPVQTDELLIHFHGASHIVADAMTRAPRPLIAASVHLGAGSRVYEEPLRDATAFLALVDEIERKAGVKVERIWLSAFSAGYGAIRAILRNENAVERVDGILLLDGLHAGYVGDRKLEIEKLQPFVRYARLAAEGKKTFVNLHSEVFPGTFASTTETADYLLSALSMKRAPILAWGPVGMQQLSVACRGKFLVLGFAGNSAPDHLDHLHGMAAFLPHLLEPKPCAET